MRSPQEIAYRIGQEAANLKLALLPPGLHPGLQMAEPGGPAPAEVAAGLRSTSFASAVLEEAARIRLHRFRLLGIEIETGPDIAWRRDYVNGRETAPAYLRRIPYLDFDTAGDHKVIWELNRHQHLVILAQAFLFTEDPEYLREIRAQLEGWLEQNPFQRSINWTSALEVAFRALSWLWLWRMIGSAFDVEFQRIFLEGLYRHGCHLERNLSFYFSPNTHLLGEAVALHALGKVFPAFPHAGNWAATGARTVEREIRRQVRNDGSHFEQSSYYHVYALDMFLFHAAIAGSVSMEYRERLAAMAHYLEALLGPDRAIPLIGDDDGGRFFHPYGARDRFGRATLASCAVYLHDRTFRYDEEDLWPQAAWWFGAANSEAPGESRGSRLFRDSGLAIMRSGDVQATIDAGPFGPGRCGHSHSDTLSFTLSVGSEEILIDPGTYTYVGDQKWRNWFRGSAAHNIIRIDGLDQATALAPFWWGDPPAVAVHEWQSDDNADILDAECRFRGFVHRRRIHFRKPNEILVTDEVDGPAGTHEVEQFWHLGSPGIRHLIEIDGQCEEVEGWRSRVFASKEPAVVLRVHRATELPCRFVTRFRLSGAAPGQDPAPRAPASESRSL